MSAPVGESRADDRPWRLGPMVRSVTDRVPSMRPGAMIPRSMRAFPFTEEVLAFCAFHDKIFVVEQNRDGQMRQLLMVEANVPGTKLIATLSYDGMPTTAAFITGAVLKHLQPAKAQAAE